MAHARDDDFTSDAPAAQRLKTADASTSGRVGLSDLPPSLVSGRIFDFLVHPESLEFLRNGLDVAKYQAQLKPLARVCRAWRGYAQSRLSHAKRMSCTLTITTSSAPAKKQLLQQAAEHGPTARELTVVMGKVVDPGRLREKYATTHKFQDRKWWETLLASFPDVVRLDLALVSVALLPMVMEVASRLCPKVKSLGLLCGPMHHEDEDWESFPAKTKALCEALERWHGVNGGLRVLTMPNFIGIIDETADYERFFRSVAAHCPQIEYLMTTSKHHGVGDEQEDWPELSLDAWREFCRNCSQLREMPWTIAPFKKEYVDEFVATPKPQLEEMKIVTAIDYWWHN